MELTLNDIKDLLLQGGYDSLSFLKQDDGVVHIIAKKGDEFSNYTAFTKDDDDNW